MRLSKLQRLAMAVAAAGILFGGISKAISTEISASVFVTNLQSYVANGEIAAAKDALAQLQAMGINQILIGDQYYLISDLLIALDNPEQALMLVQMLVASVEGGLTAYFVAQNQVVASVNWETGELFSTSSAG
ncbi:MAG: hypothetical protein ACO1OG_02070 [Devosia sp.]